ncbi:MAG: exopolysaccharide biosynthesis protein [Caldilineaceae bacterium]|nr:exopolysaccharide biosynthesis protein [Caldilineaceae bacterium]
MSTQFSDTEVSLGTALRQIIDSIEGEQITLRDLLSLIGEQGLLLFCIVLTLPFMLPVSIPGVSTVFGLVIILIGVSLVLNRLPWLPARLMDRSISNEHLIPTLEKGVQLFQRMERWMKPRLIKVTTGAFANRLNGLALTAAGVLLLFPLSFVPFSNTLPAVAILLFALGMLQRDGYFIIGGYVALLATVIYFVGLALLVILGGQSLFHLNF